MDKKSIAWKIAALVLLVGIAVAMWCIYEWKLKPEPVSGNRNAEIILVTQKDDIKKRVSYQVQTDGKTLGVVLRELDRTTMMELETAEKEGTEVVTSLYGVAEDEKGHYLFFTNADSIADKEETIGTRTYYDRETVYRCKYGVFDEETVLEEGKRYLIVYEDENQFYNAELDESDDPVHYIPYRQEYYDTDVWLYEEMQTYVRELERADNTVITVCSVAGAAFVVVFALCFIDIAKAKKYKKTSGMDDVL